MALHLIQTLPEYSDLLERLRLEPLVAVDTEAASFHRHKDRVYLLQLSTRTETHLVDPLAVAGLPGFGELLADPAIELVFHDADYDLRLLGYEFGFRAATLFDTRIAAQFLNEPGIGLAAMLEKYVGVTPDKRFQRADWSVRPLTQPMLEYAAMDTRHLPVLRDILRDRLTERGKLTWAEEEFALATAVRWPAPESPEVAALSMKGARALSPRGLAVFRELYVWRTRTAETLDRAAFRIIGNEALIALTERTPKDAAGLAAIPGVGKDLVERRGQEILDAIRSEEHTSELQSLAYLVCRLLLEKKNGQAGARQRHRAGRRAEAAACRDRVPGQRARVLGGAVRADVTRRLGRPARAAGPGDPAVR